MDGVFGCTDSVMFVLGADDMIGAVGFKKGGEFFGKKFTVHVSTNLFGVSTKVRHQAPIGKDEVRFGGEEIELFGTRVRVDEDHEVLSASDALGADFAAKNHVHIFPGVD